eukprot:SAG22_NODE_9283_length_598_cov_6.448898_1_plen_77_part_01
MPPLWFAAAAQQPAPMGGDVEAGGPPPAANFMQDFFNQVAAVKRDMITGDDNGTIKYWNKTMSMIGAIENAHQGTSA